MGLRVWSPPSSELGNRLGTDKGADWESWLAPPTPCHPQVSVPGAGLTTWKGGGPGEGQKVAAASGQGLCSLCRSPRLQPPAPPCQCAGGVGRGGVRWAQQECVLWWSPPSFLPAFVPLRGLWAVQVLGPGPHASLWPRSGRLRCHRVRCVLLPVRGVPLSGVLALPWAWVCHQWVCLWLVGQGRVTVLAAAGAVGSDGSDRK